jgi:hypothetical protein
MAAKKGAKPAPNDALIKQLMSSMQSVVDNSHHALLERIKNIENIEKRHDVLGMELNSQLRAFGGFIEGYNERVSRIENRLEGIEKFEIKRGKTIDATLDKFGERLFKVESTAKAHAPNPNPDSLGMVLDMLHRDHDPCRFIATGTTIVGEKSGTSASKELIRSLNKRGFDITIQTAFKAHDDTVPIDKTHKAHVLHKGVYIGGSGATEGEAMTRLAANLFRHTMTS